MRAGGAGAVVKAVMRDEAQVRVTRARLGAGGVEDDGPPCGRVRAGYNGDAVCLVRPGFEERGPEERKRGEQQAALGANGLTPWAERMCPAVLIQGIDPSGRVFGRGGVEARALGVEGGGEQVNGEVKAGLAGRIVNQAP
jgi:hypothetical protein